MTSVDIELRPLEAADADALQALVESDPGYAERVTGHPPGPADAQSLLMMRPPDLAEHDKVVLGAWEGDDLVAVVDLLRGWPDRDTVHVGLLQVHGAQQGRGLGRLVHEQMLRLVRDWPGVVRLRAAIVATNAAQADPFWQAMGYTPTGEPKDYTYDTLRTTVRIWTRPVTTESTMGTTEC